VKLLRVFLILWREILECSPYQRRGEAAVAAMPLQQKGGRSPVNR
jgi:hypothetical protein